MSYSLTMLIPNRPTYNALIFKVHTKHIIFSSQLVKKVLTNVFLQIADDDGAQDSFPIYGAGIDVSFLLKEEMQTCPWPTKKIEEDQNEIQRTHERIYDRLHKIEEEIGPQQDDDGVTPFS